ncbi:MAG: 2,3-bisphosphoglycerate-independent phosphoglycerate mutase [Thermoanaerobaculia bacterium]|nr:2,3-bisphosphoglycerate-independent phosphoglycerate mutase [Thermoanaerobaculia bacterium]
MSTSDHQELLARLAQSNDRRLVLLVVDGVGDIRTETQPRTALETADTPHLDRLARRGACGRIVPVAPGVTPGSGPGHLALFGYDPRRPEVDIGRGVLEARGLELELERRTVAARGNFATADADGRLVDRRAGRLPTEECRRLTAILNQALEEAELPARVHAGEGHRFVLLVRGDDLSADVLDTDPQKLEVPPLSPTESSPQAAATAELVRKIVGVMEERLRDEPRANRVLLRGFSKLPDLPPLPELHAARFGAFAGYPLYRGVAAACGMQVVPCGKRIDDIVSAVAGHWEELDFFFLHVKQSDQAGEDGDVEAKVRVLEEVDAALPRLLDLGPDVVAVTGDHSTPAPLQAHSWHPVPVVIVSDRCFADDATRFDESEASRGHLGTFPAYQLMGLLLANAGRLAKFGA